MVRLQVIHASEFSFQEKPKTNHMFILVDSLKALREEDTEGRVTVIS